MKISFQELAAMKAADDAARLAAFSELVDRIKNGDRNAFNLVRDFMDRHCNSVERPDALLMLSDFLSGEHFWRLIHAEWASFDRIDHYGFEQAFRKFKSDWRESYLEGDDFELFKTLPDVITVYRGQSAHAATGLSWTTNIDVARAFARGHRGLWNHDPVLIKAEIHKSAIAGAYNSRNESEIVCFSTDAPKIVATYSNSEVA